MWHRRRGSSRSTVDGLVLVLAGLAAAQACAHSSTSPNPVSTLNLRTGPAWLNISGYVLSSDPNLPECSVNALPRDGTTVNTWVNLTQSGGDWIGRAPAEVGTLEIRMHGTGVLGVGGEGIVGTVAGTVIDTGWPLQSQQDVRINIAGSGGSTSGVVEGAANPVVFLAIGRITGAIQISDHLGNAANCTVTSWTLQPKVQTAVQLLPDLLR